MAVGGRGRGQRPGRMAWPDLSWAGQLPSPRHAPSSPSVDVSGDSRGQTPRMGCVPGVLGLCVPEPRSCLQVIQGLV